MKNSLSSTNQRSSFLMILIVISIIISGIALLLSVYLLINSNKPSEQISVIQSNSTQETTKESLLNTLQLSKFSFTLPADWKVQFIEKNTVFISVPDPNYTVTIPFEIKKISPITNSALLKELPSGIKIYEEFCAPTLACWYIVDNKETYLATFEEPKSNETRPDNIDGVWFPSTTVTRDELLQVILSVQ